MCSREIENRLLDPYRYDATKKKELIREANLKSKNQALIKKKIEPKVLTVQSFKTRHLFDLKLFRSR